MTVLIRILLLVVGYLIGNNLFGYYYGKRKGRDIRKEGSGNTGATNALRVLGKKAGILVFIGDFLKAFIPVLLLKLLLPSRFVQLRDVYIMYLGLGIVLGHDFPFFLGFKGGKGVSSMCGVFIAYDWKMTLIGLVLFFGTAFKTKIVSLSSIVLSFGILIMGLVFPLIRWVKVPVSHRPEYWILIACISMLTVIRHIPNIIRLIRGTEPKIGEKKAVSSGEHKA